MHPPSPHAGRPGWCVRAGHLVVTAKVELDEVAFLEGVLDWIAMVTTPHLDYLIETDMVELASLLFVASPAGST
jgi:hypothetical protein